MLPLHRGSSRRGPPLLHSTPLPRILAFAAVLAASSLYAQPLPLRPHITGISHVAYYATDMPKSLTFWHDLLGFDLSYDRKQPDSTSTTVAFLKVNDHHTSNSSPTDRRKPTPKTS